MATIRLFWRIRAGLRHKAPKLANYAATASQAVVGESVLPENQLAIGIPGHQRDVQRTQFDLLNQTRPRRSSYT